MAEKSRKRAIGTGAIQRSQVGTSSRFDGRRRAVPFGFDEWLYIDAQGAFNLAQNRRPNLRQVRLHADGICTDIDHHKPIFATLPRVIGFEFGADIDVHRRVVTRMAFPLNGIEFGSVVLAE